MDIRFNDEEVNEVATLIINKMADNAGLSDKDRAMLKRWRSTNLKLGTDDMEEMVRKVNDDFVQGLARRQRSQLRKPDWRT
ncbi:MAG TPA: hypothetical protein PJ994_00850 [Tepidiformaceae bacterium]|nr:hypothetical protein [Tepidiformaceae bacterium]